MDQLPDIIELGDLLYRVNATMGAAEAQGALCGMICAQGSVDLSDWIDHVLGEQEPGAPTLHQAVDKLTQLEQVTLATMNDPVADFRMLLLDDDDNLMDRVEALAQWCEGFIYGLAAGGITEDSELPDDSKELVGDMVEITRAGHEGSDDSDELDSESDLEAYEEIEEYVRMGVLMMYEELQPLQTAQSIH